VQKEEQVGGPRICLHGHVILRTSKGNGLLRCGRKGSRGDSRERRLQTQGFAPYSEGKVHIRHRAVGGVGQYREAERGESLIGKGEY